jgi:hypothetical protein
MLGQYDKYAPNITHYVFIAPIIYEEAVVMKRGPDELDNPNIRQKISNEKETRINKDEESDLNDEFKKELEVSPAQALRLRTNL